MEIPAMTNLESPRKIEWTLNLHLKQPLISIPVPHGNAIFNGHQPPICYDINCISLTNIFMGIRTKVGMPEENHPLGLPCTSSQRELPSNYS
jgi:hypothetical protein